MLIEANLYYSLHVFQFGHVNQYRAGSSIGALKPMNRINSFAKSVYKENQYGMHVIKNEFSKQYKDQCHYEMHTTGFITI